MEYPQAVLSCFTPLDADSCFLKCSTVYPHLETYYPKDNFVYVGFL